MNEKLFTGPEVLKKVGAPGPKISKPNLKDYRAFVQCAGGGSRSLVRGTYLLYDHAKA